MLYFCVCVVLILFVIRYVLQLILRDTHSRVLVIALLSLCQLLHAVLIWPVRAQANLSTSEGRQKRVLFVVAMISLGAAFSINIIGIIWNQSDYLWTSRVGKLLIAGAVAQTVSTVCLQLFVLVPMVLFYIRKQYARGYPVRAIIGHQRLKVSIRSILADTALGSVAGICLPLVTCAMMYCLWYM